jgi:UDP-glucose 4-epimerase
MRRLLITGAAGFLASHLTDLMLARGWTVVGVDDLSHGSMLNLEAASRSRHFSFHNLDICTLARLRDCVGKVDAVAHLAAYKIPRYTTATNTLLVNSQGTLNLLRLACEQSARFVITSTSDVYGKNPKLPFSEDDDSVLGPSTVTRWAYAASKLFDEHLVFAMAEDAGIYATVLRIFGSYGPRQNLSWWGGPQSVFIDAILRGEKIPIHGDGMQTRSFTFVRDTVRGIAAALEATTANQQLVNIGSEEEISILELAHCIHRLCGKSGSPEIEMIPYGDIANRKYEDVRRRVPDIRKALNLLNFQASVRLEDGLRETIAWQRERTIASEVLGPVFA